MIRNPDHADDVRADGGEPTVCDLEKATLPEVAMAIEGATASSSPREPDRAAAPSARPRWTATAAIKLLEAATSAHVRGYVMISAMGTEIPPARDDVFSVYLRAKADADRALMDSDRDWTIVRPGRLTDDPGTGTARIARQLPHGEISRDDVAATVAVAIHEPLAVGRVLSVIGGDTPIPAALSAAIHADGVPGSATPVAGAFPRGRRSRRAGAAAVPARRSAARCGRVQP